MDAGLQNATGMMALTQGQNIAAPAQTANKAAAEKAAKQFEAVFITQFLGQMFEGIKTDGPMGGGQGEQMFRSLMLDQYGEQIANQGGFGLSKAITRSLLSHQEDKS